MVLKLFSSILSKPCINPSRILVKYISDAVKGCGAQEKTEKVVQEAGSADKKNGLVLGVYQSGDKFELSAAASEVDQKSGGKICRYLNEISCELKAGRAFVVTDVLPELGPVALSSLGCKLAGYNELEALDEARENVRVCVGAGVRALTTRGCDHIAVDCASAPDAAAEAAHLAAWRFDEFKSCGDKHREVQVREHAAGGAGEGAEGCAAWREGAVYGRAQNWARYLSDMPANNMTPVDFAQAALDVLCPLGVHVTAHELEWMAAQRMEAFLAVARGSCEPPVFLQCEYKGSDEPPVLIAAKGITFDSGGLCLKQAPQMRETRGSMAGAAVTLAVIKILAELKVRIHVCAVVPLCENMVSGQCMKVGDVVRTLNGLSVQIEDTDLEGRLALADALVFGQALYRPALVLDIATLTSGVQVATGGGAFGCFTSSERLWGAVREAGARTGDRPWRFPLWQYYQHQIDNDLSVDLRNKGSGKASACIGAAFLKNFICGRWVHVDTTGVGRVTAQHDAHAPYLRARRMSGRPARTIAAFLQRAALPLPDSTQQQ